MATARKPSRRPDPFKDKSRKQLVTHIRREQKSFGTLLREADAHRHNEIVLQKRMEAIAPVLGRICDNNNQAVLEMRDDLGCLTFRKDRLVVGNSERLSDDNLLKICDLGRRLTIAAEDAYEAAKAQALATKKLE